MLRAQACIETATGIVPSAETDANATPGSDILRTAVLGTGEFTRGLFARSPRNLDAGTVDGGWYMLTLKSELIFERISSMPPSTWLRALANACCT